MLIGIDIINCERIEQALNKSGQKFIDRVLTDNEKNYLINPFENIVSFAGIWAAKEAAVKAIGIGFRHGVTFHDISIYHDNYGKPYYLFKGELIKIIHYKKIKDFTLSISHSQQYAVAAALFCY